MLRPPEFANKCNNQRKAENSGQPQLRGTWDQAGIQWVRVGYYSRIENCVVHDCAWNGIVMSESCDIDVVTCRSDDNGNVSVGPDGWGQFEAMGILLWEGRTGHGNTSVRISSCTVTGNEKSGIELLGRSNRDNLVLGCVAADNNGYGIAINAIESNHAGSIVGCTCLDNCEGGALIVGDHLIAEANFMARNNHGEVRGIIGPAKEVL